MCKFTTAGCQVLMQLSLNLFLAVCSDAGTWLDWSKSFCRALALFLLYFLTQRSRYWSCCGALSNSPHITAYFLESSLHYRLFVQPEYGEPHMQKVKLEKNKVRSEAIRKESVVCGLHVQIHALSVGVLLLFLRCSLSMCYKVSSK